MIVGAAATAALGLVPGPARVAFDASGSNENATYQTTYRRALAEFEAAVRPSSEAYWVSYNRAVAEVYARAEAARRAALVGI